METNKSKVIKLYNRYDDPTWLEHLEVNKYVLHCGEYCRFGYKEEDSQKDLSTVFDYAFVDPSGGPFMHIGGEVTSFDEKEKYTIDKIYAEKIAEKCYRTILELH